MVAIEKENKSLKGVLPKDYARPGLDKKSLGELLDLLGKIGLIGEGHQSKDILGRVYEYFLSNFALAEGKRAGQFYTPQSVVRVLVEMIAPFHGRVFDPCCGSGGMFVQSEKFVESHGGRSRDISIFGQESNETTRRLVKMNLAIRGIEADLGPEQADSFHRDLFKDLKADYILANPPFNSSDWGGETLREDPRWVYGVPPSGNANFAWVQISYITWPLMAWRDLCWLTARFPLTKVEKARSAKISLKRILWIVSSPCRDSFSIPPRSPSPSGFWHATGRMARAWKDTC